MGINYNQLDQDSVPELNAQTSVDQPASGSGKYYYKVVSGRTELFSQDDQGIETQITSNGSVLITTGGEANTASNLGSAGDGVALFTAKAGVNLPFKRIQAGTNVTIDEAANFITINASGGGGGGAVDSVNGETGVVVLDSDDISQGSINLYTTTAEKADAAVAYAHSQVAHAPSNAEANYSQVSAGEVTAGTETALRSFSPKDIADMAGTHGGGGGGSTSPVTHAILVLPQTGSATLADRLAGATIDGTAIGSTDWSVATADTAGEANLGTNADSLVFTWPAAEGDRTAHVVCFQKATSGPGAIQGWSPMEVTTASDQKTNVNGTSGAVHLNGKGLVSDRDLKVLITLI